MSYDVAVRVDGAEVFWRNYTSNCVSMWRIALGRGLAEFDGAPCSEAAGALAAGVERMRTDPAPFREVEPHNGWGDYAGALAFLTEIADAAARHPSGILRVLH